MAAQCHFITSNLCRWRLGSFRLACWGRFVPRHCGRRSPKCSWRELWSLWTSPVPGSTAGCSWWRRWWGAAGPSSICRLWMASSRWWSFRWRPLRPYWGLPDGKPDVLDRPQGRVLPDSCPSGILAISSVLSQGMWLLFRALCFGLSTVPQVFTRVFALVSEWAHWRSVHLLHYLDDWLVIAELRTLLQHWDSSCAGIWGSLSTGRSRPPAIHSCPVSWGCW